MKSMEIENWLSDAKVVEWLKIINTERTVVNYKREFPIYMRFVTENTEYKTPTQIIESRIQQQKSDDMNTKRFWETVGIKFMHSLEDKEFTRNTVATYLRTMLSFFSKNHLPLYYSRNELIGAIRAKGKGKSNPLSKAWIPTKDDVKILYRFAESSRDKAITLMLFQSGVSEIEVCELQIQDMGFYDENGKWKLNPDEHLYYANERSKTREIFQTCISTECLESIKDMLQSRGMPKEGYLFVSFRGNKLSTRDINAIFKGEGERKGIVEKAFNGRVKNWQTKNMRDGYMNALEQAKIPQKIADLMSGHKPDGAKSKYIVTPETIKMAYADAFKFLSINGASMHAKQLVELQNDFQQTKSQLADLIAEIRNENKAQANRMEKLEAKLTELGVDVSTIKESTGRLDERLTYYEKHGKKKPAVDTNIIR